MSETAPRRSRRAVPNAVVQAHLIAVTTAIATLSVGLGLDAGIHRASVLNIVLAVALVAFVLVAGSILHAPHPSCRKLAYPSQNLVAIIFDLYAFEPTGWFGGWNTTTKCDRGRQDDTATSASACPTLSGR